MLSRLNGLIVLEELAKSVDKLCLGVGLLLERLHAKLEMNIECSVSDGYGDLGCKFDFHAFDLIVLYVDAIFLLLHHQG